jgi:hypothetical protein
MPSQQRVEIEKKNGLLKSLKGCFKVNEMFQKQRAINSVALSEEVLATTVRISNSSITIINESQSLNNNNNNNFEINNLDNDNMNIASTCYSEISKFNSESELNDIEDVSLSDFSYAISKNKIKK